MNGTWYGTNHFMSRHYAYAYYARQGENCAQVDAKIEAKEIVIGDPEVPEGCGLFVIADEGRYAIHTAAAPEKVAELTYDVEHTDTFGGEANYAWCNRRTIKAPEGADNALIMRRAKAALGLSGMRGQTNEMGEELEFRPYGICQVVFVRLSN